jgi:hypothetical protein
MSDDNAIELIKRGERRFAARSPLDSFRMEVALNFAPQHALWTASETLGSDFASHLVDGTPLIIASEYVGMIGSMLRPAGKQWAWHRTPHEELNEIPAVRSYLDWRSTQLMRITFDRVTGAEGALNECDEFYSLFGDAVLSVDYADNSRETLSVQHYHSKDCTWTIGKQNKPDTLTRKEEMPARIITARFSQTGDKVHEKIHEACEKDGDQTFELRHEILPAQEYDAYIKKGAMKRKDGWVSVWIDVTHKQVIRETHNPNFRYVIPRAGRRYGFAYGYSRAVMVALPDARLIQQQATAILEAAEKQLSPPLIAFQDSIRGDMRLDGITWVDRSFADKSVDPVTPLELGKNFQLGVESLLRTEAQLARAFKLDRLRFPDTRKTKTREEAAFLIDEFVRSALPIFAPMKVEYNDEFLYAVDTLIEQAGGYAGREKPQELDNVELVFQWDNPLTDMVERQKAQRVAEVSQLGQTIAALETAAAQVPALKQIDASKMMRQATISVGGADWLLSEDEAAEAADASNQANMLREGVAAAPNIASLIDSGVGAAQAAATIPNPAEPAYPMLPSPV